MEHIEWIFVDQSHLDNVRNYRQINTYFYDMTKDLVFEREHIHISKQFWYWPTKQRQINQHVTLTDSKLLFCRTCSRLVAMHQRPLEQYITANRRLERPEKQLSRKTVQVTKCLWRHVINCRPSLGVTSALLWASQRERQLPWGHLYKWPEDTRPAAAWKMNPLFFVACLPRPAAAPSSTL